MNIIPHASVRVVREGEIVTTFPEKVGTGFSSGKYEKKLKRGFEEIKTCIALVGSHKKTRVGQSKTDKL